MFLQPSTRLGAYEIISRIGAGGMGEVYRARDPRLGREVAIKVSAERYSDRFEREIRALAALNHPNICHVYDVGPNYVVMELIEGPTLADRIKEGALPVDEALKLARQIADALDAAHEKGIIHRDLKPANVKITPDGVVKVLDFGLAKIAEPATAPRRESSQTVTIEATRVGQVLGTAAYMAPEQARGKALDKRADIWAFGVVLYEMVTGQRLFEGETISDTLARVLTNEPVWAGVPSKVHPLLRSCLEKDPRFRLRDIGDGWRLLEDRPTPSVRGGTRWRAAAGVLAVIAGACLWAAWRGAPPATQSSVRLDLNLGPDISLRTPIGSAVILSPDGSRLVFVSQGQDGTRHLFTRRLDQSNAAQLSGTQGAYAPFFSPDGLWVGFFAEGKLKKTRIESSDPISLCDAPAGRGASWGEDGNIIAALDTQGGLSQIPADGEKVIPLTQLSPGENTHRWPHVLPGGKTVLFTASVAYGNFNEASIAAVSLKDHTRKTVLEGAGMYPHYVPTGHLTYLTKGNLVAVPFDLERLEVRGKPVPLEAVAGNLTVGSAHVDFSRNGTLAYRVGAMEGLRTIQWLDSEGETRAFAINPAYRLALRLSPEGGRVAMNVSEGANTDLWIYDWQRDTNTRLTNGMVANFVSWSPDGRFVVFYAPGGMFWSPADGAGKPQPLTRSKTLQLPNCFTADGSRLVFTELVPGAGAEMRIMPVRNESGQLHAGEPQLLLKTPTVNTFATFSPDGRWLAYADAEAGRYEVNVRSFPDRGTRVQISSGGGTVPVWSRNGHEIFYRTEDQRIMRVAYTVKGESFIPDKPRVWFEQQLANTGLTMNFDLSPDGKHFVVLMPAESPEPRESQSHLMLMVNFFDELRRVVRQGN